MVAREKQLDLMIYFYAQESAKTPENPKPSYIFPLEKFRSYFGKEPKTIRKAVLNSDEYKAYAAEHSRPLPPPEMSLLTQTLVTLCPMLDPPRPLNAAGTGALLGADARAGARNCDVDCEAMSRGASTVPSQELISRPSVNC